MNTDQILLIDLSSLAHPLYHISASEPDPNWTSTQIVARVRALSTQHPHTAICCDNGKSFRNDLAPRVSLGDGKYAGYKADRPERDARLYHQIDLAIEKLRADGYPIWKAENFEADDVIASAVHRTLAIDGATALIATADKDLLQLVSPRVTVKNTGPNADGSVRGVDEVIAKFGVTPTQMLDYLSLVGDTSDNIVGAKGIGSVTATKLLKAHGSIDAIYAAMDKGVVKDITPGIRSSLVEFKDRRDLVSQLIALRTDAPIPFEEIAAERTAPPMEETVGEPFKQGDDSNDQPLPQAWTELGTAAATDALRATVARVEERIQASAPKAGDVARLVPAGQPSAPNGADSGQIVASQGVPVDFSQQLEPRSPDEAARLAGHMFASRLFSAYGTWQGVLATILAGRELGIPAMASLRAFHVIDGRPTLSADTLAALVVSSGKAKYFRCTERTPTRATFITQRLPAEDYPPQSITVTIEEMKSAWRKDQKAWDASGWGKTPAAMLVARAKSTLARLEYPDVCGNIYTPEEME